MAERNNCPEPFARNDPTDPGGTFRPNLPPTAAKGTDFDPLPIEQREPTIQNLPLSPMAIFQSFVPISLLQEWADATNSHVEAILAIEKPPARLTKPKWRPVAVSEIYVFLAMVICMTNGKETAMTDYWASHDTNSLGAVYPWTSHMPLRRFEALWRYLRFCDYSDFEPQKAPAKAYLRIEKWSQHIQKTITTFYIPGSSIAVDECVQGFTGKSGLKTTIPNKPTPEGIKIWAVAEKGILLRWLWHVPGQGAVGIDPATREEDKSRKLTPTQSVVIALIKMLPNASYHVYLDNLFSSPALYKRLREFYIAASGTCRINCGIHEDLVGYKVRPANMPYLGTIQIPTKDGQVSSGGSATISLYILLILIISRLIRSLSAIMM